jgi:hypothetical protein
MVEMDKLSELVSKYGDGSAVLRDVAQTYGFGENAQYLVNLANDKQMDSRFKFALIRFIGQTYKAMQNDFPKAGI